MRKPFYNDKTTNQMRKLNNMPLDEALKAIYSSQKLTEELDKSIYDSGMYWVDDKVRCFGTSVDYSLSPYEPCFFKIRDYGGFLDGVKKSVYDYGCTDSLRKLIKRCEKLLGSNLFHHYSDKLCKQYYEEEIKPDLDYIEKSSYRIYIKDDNCPEMLDSVSDFIKNFCTNITIDDEGNIIETTIIGKLKTA